METPLFSGHLPGTLQSSKTSSQVLEPLMPSLSSFLEVLKPGIPFAGNQRRSWLDLRQGGLVKGKLTLPTDSDTRPHLTPKFSLWMPNSVFMSHPLSSQHLSCQSASPEFSGVQFFLNKTVSPQLSSLSQGHDAEDTLRAHANSSVPFPLATCPLRSPNSNHEHALARVTWMHRCHQVTGE